LSVSCDELESIDLLGCSRLKICAGASEETDQIQLLELSPRMAGILTNVHLLRCSNLKTLVDPFGTLLLPEFCGLQINSFSELIAAVKQDDALSADHATAGLPSSLIATILPSSAQHLSALSPSTSNRRKLLARSSSL